MLRVPLAKSNLAPKLKTAAGRAAVLAELAKSVAQNGQVSSHVVFAGLPGIEFGSTTPDYTKTALTLTSQYLWLVEADVLHSGSSTEPAMILASFHLPAH